MPPTVSLPHNNLTIAFASAASDGAAAAWRSLKLPHLQQLLAHSRIILSDLGDASDFCPPHERAWARQLQLPLQSGCAPWAAWQQQATDPAPQQQAWAWLSPCHWRIGADTVHMGNPADLALSETESRALLAILAPWFAEDQITLHYERADRWLVSGEPLEDLCCASLDRVIGRDVRPWLPSARSLNRLHSEVQMLLYTHPFNAQRSNSGLPPINAFWLHGAGRLQAAVAQQPLPHLMQPNHAALTALRAAALEEDWPAWGQAWQQLDASLLRELLAAYQAGQTVELTLCGDKNALTWQTQPSRWWQKIRQTFQQKDLPDLAAML